MYKININLKYIKIDLRVHEQKIFLDSNRLIRLTNQKTGCELDRYFEAYKL